MSDPSSRRGRRPPPEHTRFKPGQSGNPRGRPPGRKNLRTVLDEELAQLISVTEHGRTVRLTKLVVIIRRMTHDSLKGDHRARELLLRLDREVGAPADDGAPDGREPDAPGALPTQDALRRIAKRLAHLRDDEEN